MVKSEVTDAEITEMLEEEAPDSCPTDWHPIYRKWSWRLGPGTPLITSVVVVVPTGVLNKKTEFNIRVHPDCDKLTISVTWPKQLADPAKLHTWMDKEYSEFHPRVYQFAESLYKIRSHKSDGLTTTTHIKLDHKVVRSIKDIHRFGFNGDTTNIVYLDLEEDKKDDYIDEDVDEVVML